MSTSTPATTTATQDGNVNLPPGVTVGPGRETSQLNAQGQVVQGMLFPVSLPGGSTTSVFVPYSVLPNAAQVAALFTNRISALLAIPGQG